jgi:hypothetical protein
MKKILIPITTIILFVACNTTNDCECTFSVKEDIDFVKHITIPDWNGKCEKIDYHDIHLDEYTSNLDCIEI